jgi:hypothetical protein
MFSVSLTAYYNVSFEMSDQMMYLNIHSQKPSSLHKASSNALEHLPKELITSLNGTVACIEYSNRQCMGYVKTREFGRRVRVELWAPGSLVRRTIRVPRSARCVRNTTDWYLKCEWELFEATSCMLSMIYARSCSMRAEEPLTRRLFAPGPRFQRKSPCGVHRNTQYMWISY